MALRVNILCEVPWGMRERLAILIALRAGLAPPELAVHTVTVEDKLSTVT